MVEKKRWKKSPKMSKKKKATKAIQYGEKKLQKFQKKNLTLKLVLQTISIKIHRHTTVLYSAQRIKKTYYSSHNTTV